MSFNSGLVSSNDPTWATPRDLFRWLDARFHFTLDPCSSHENALCEKHYTETENGLIQPWTGERVFMNPPYGRTIEKWVCKAAHEADLGALVVGLLPCRTEASWWQTFVLGRAHITYLQGRLKFGDSKNSAPFPSALVVWWGQACKGKF